MGTLRAHRYRAILDNLIAESMNTEVKNMADLVDEVVTKGWTDVSKGVFFRPVKLRAELPVVAWKLEDWSEYLAPLEQALDALVADQGVFDAIIMAANPRTNLAAAYCLPFCFMAA